MARAEPGVAAGEPRSFARHFRPRSCFSLGTSGRDPRNVAFPAEILFLARHFRPRSADGRVSGRDPRTVGVVPVRSVVAGSVETGDGLVEDLVLLAERKPYEVAAGLLGHVEDLARYGHHAEGLR